MSQVTARPALVIEIDGIPIAYEVRGTGAPVIVVHGWSADHRYMLADLEPIFEASPGWQRIYLDLPGHGTTPAPSWLGTQDQMISVLGAFIDTVTPDGPVALVGSSYGAHLALSMVRQVVERVRGVALLIPDVPASDGSRVTEEAVVVVEDRSIFHDLAPDEQWIPGALSVHEQRMLDEIRAHDMPAYRIADYEFLARLEANYLPNGVQCNPRTPFLGPSLILCGRQDAIVGFRSAWSLLDEFPRATYAVVDLTGHHLGRIERPRVFNALVADWMERMTVKGSGS